MKISARQLHAQKLPDGILREEEVTESNVVHSTVRTRVELLDDGVVMGMTRLSTFGLGTEVVDTLTPDEAEHLAKKLVDVAQQARAVQARKPWPGGPLGGTRQG